MGSAAKAQARRSVAEASRILAGEKLLDAFGHVSVRHPDWPSRFLLSCSMAPALVTPADVFEHGLDGAVVPPAEARPFLERFIHAGIYRARADVGAVVHSHAPAVLPFTVSSEAPVRPIFHMCGHLADLPRPFEIADHRGNASDMLVSDEALGRALAAHLGAASVVLMRSHGFTAIGPDVRQAVFRAIYTARNCEVQQAAMALGTPRFLTDGEARSCAAATAGQVGRAWDLWLLAHARDDTAPPG